MGAEESLLILLAIVALLLFGIFYYGSKEKMESFKRFYKKLRPAGATKSEAKNLFHYMWTRFNKQYHLFFQEPVIAEKAVMETGTNKEILTKLHIRENRDTVDIVQDKFVPKSERLKSKNSKGN